MAKVPSRYPQPVSKAVWYYETPTTLEFVVEIRNQQQEYVTTAMFKVPAEMLRKSLSRMRRPARSAKRVRKGR